MNWRRKRKVPEPVTFLFAEDLLKIAQTKRAVDDEVDPRQVVFNDGRNPPRPWLVAEGTS